MKRRFFCEFIPEVDETVVLSESEVYHIQNILRKGPEDEIILLDGKGVEAVARILPRPSNEKAIRLACRILKKRNHFPPKIRCSLHISPPRSQAIRQIIRQAVELGISEIVPVITQFSVCKPDKHSLSKWYFDAREACKQSGNPFLPKIHPPQTLESILTHPIEPGFMGMAPNSGLADPGNAKPDNLQVIKKLFNQTKNGKMAVWIGPEGGFTSTEFHTLLKLGIVPIIIGQWTLRVETAVVASLTLVNLYLSSRL